jgi:preprotein translocase subunit YajC
MTTHDEIIGMETGAEVVRTDGLHGQVVSVDRHYKTFRVQWCDHTASSHFNNGAAMAARLLGVDMEEAR